MGAKAQRLTDFDALIGDWSAEITHPFFGDTVIAGRVQFEWLAGERFLIQRVDNEHPDIPDSISVIGVMEGDDDLSMQYFDSRGVHRIYRMSIDDRVWRIWRDEPGFAQRFTGTLSSDGSELDGLWELAREAGEWADDLEIRYRRA